MDHATLPVEILDLTRFLDANRCPLRLKTLWGLFRMILQSLAGLPAFLV
jgi:hypothetical protein